MLQDIEDTSNLHLVRDRGSNAAGPDSVVGRFIRRASPEINAAVRRVEAALADQLRGG
jgi:hypothetical protein